VGSQSSDLIALDLQKGTLRWKYRTKEGIGESSPCVAGGVVYVGDLSGVLHAVQTADGKELWTFKTGSEIKSSPVVVDNKVLVGSYDENLYCVAARTGELVWKFRTNGPVHGTPGVAEGLAYIAGCDEVFRGIRIADGKEAFEVSTGAYTGASPALVPGFAYFGTFNNDVLGLDLRARRIVWRYEHPERQFPYYSSSAVAEGRVGWPHAFPSMAALARCALPRLPRGDDLDGLEPCYVRRTATQLSLGASGTASC
jgi:outer membrane protein assembly factor BamB